MPRRKRTKPKVALPHRRRGDDGNDEDGNNNREEDDDDTAVEEEVLSVVRVVLLGLWLLGIGALGFYHLPGMIKDGAPGSRTVNAIYCSAITLATYVVSSSFGCLLCFLFVCFVLKSKERSVLVHSCLCMLLLTADCRFRATFSFLCRYRIGYVSNTIILFCAVFLQYLLACHRLC
jgi:hypothetical protein